MDSSEEEDDVMETSSPMNAKYSARSSELSEISENQFSLSQLQKDAEHSVDELERLVEKQHQFLLSSGYISQSSSDSKSMSMSHHRTFEELEKEINSIKDLLNEKEHEYNKLSLRESELDR
jgi:beta-lactam-binding protein with PASTA domain